MQYNSNELILYRLERSKLCADEAKSALDNGFLFNAENRIYYSCFYAVTALALKNEFITSKHKQLIGWFNHYFIKPGIIPIQYGRFYKSAFDKRQESDYDDYVTFEVEEVINDYNEMLLFINYLRDFILKDQ